MYPKKAACLSIRKIIRMEEAFTFSNNLVTRHFLDIVRNIIILFKKSKEFIAY